jgi:hypothetical protein
LRSRRNKKPISGGIEIGAQFVSFNLSHKLIHGVESTARVLLRHAGELPAESRRARIEFRQEIADRRSPEKG